MYMNDGNKTKINLRNKSVFITGVAGFIGSNLAKRLLSTVEGVKVVGLDNMNHYYDVRLKEARLNELEQFDNFSFVKGNLADKAVIESIFEQYKPEIVVNLGAQAGVRYSITNPDAYVEANLIGFYPVYLKYLKRIVVRGCDENDKDALRWCVAKPDKRKSRKMSCKPFATLVYQKMGWDSECRYKMLGYRITFEGETLYVFDLLVPEIFHEGQRKKNAVDSQDNAASTKPVNSRKGFYLDDIVGTFGVPVEEHRKESEVKQMDGYVSMGILTGKIAPEAGKD